jgi:flagellar biosynthesis protein FlhG
MPASSGLMDARKWDDQARARLASMLENFPWEMDAVLIDAGAGIQENVLSLHNPGYQSMLVLTPDPASMTDAYGLIKLLRRRQGITEVSVIVNQVTDGRQAQGIFQRLQEVVGKFLDVQLSYLGHCPRDEKIQQSVMKRKTLLDLYPEAQAASCLELLAKRLKSERIASDGGRAVALHPGRFREEPALVAPRNGAGFWMSLLSGEVEA